MPAAPLLVIGAQVTGTAAAIGSTLATAVGLGTVSSLTATAIGSGVIGGGITAAMGGDASDVLKSAVVSGGASYAGSLAGGAVKNLLPGSTPDAISRTISSAAAGGAGSTVAALGYGQSPEQALQSGLKGAATAGLTQAGVEGAKGLLTQGPQQAGEARLKVPQQGQYERGAPIAEVPSQTGVTSRVPTGGGQGFTAPSGLLYDSRFAPSQTMRATEGGGVQPAYQSGQSLITPEGMAGTAQPFRETRDFNPPPLTRSRERLLSEALELGLTEGLADRRAPTQPGATTAFLGTGTTAAPGSQALAQALRVDSGTALFGSDKEGRRRPVWNVESLKLKDEMGA